jgi:hypothetical protein
MSDQSHTNGAELAAPPRTQARSVLARPDLPSTGANGSVGPNEMRTPRGIFDTQSSLFTRYTARIVFRDKLLGGIPKDPKLIEGWLRSRAGLTDGDEVRHTMLRTLVELGVDVDASMSFEQLERASEAVAARKQTTGFKVGERGLYLESRQVKAMLKESTNVVFGGERFGPTRKTGKPFVAERVFIEPDRLWLGVQEPAGVEMTIGHVFGATGPRSIVGYHEYVERASLDFRVLTMRDCLAAEQWADLWVHAQENGLGALRSQGFGRFYIEQWQRID